MTVSETDKVAKLEAPKPKAKLAEVEEEAIEEPVKRVAKKDEAPAPKKDISKILSDWDDA